jgi:hypothetical protein
MPLHVLARVHTDPADSRTLNFDAKSCCRLFRYRPAYEFPRVANRIWMWKRIAHGQPRFAIVCVPGQRLGIIQSPRPDRRLLQLKLIDHSLRI